MALDAFFWCRRDTAFAMRFKVMQDLDGRYVLTTHVINAAGRCGFWFSDYRYDSKKAAWSCPDRPVSFE